MAERRMFHTSVVESDAFLDLPIGSQLLYFHLAMRADDDGFINNPRKIQRMIGASDDDLKVLCLKRFILPFDSGVVVIKHWKIHNYIRNDRYKPTVYVEEKAMLTSKENGVYTEVTTIGIPNGNQMDTQYRLGKDSIGEFRVVEGSANGYHSDIDPNPENDEISTKLSTFYQHNKKLNIKHFIHIVEMLITLRLRQVFCMKKLQKFKKIFDINA